MANFTHAIMIVVTITALAAVLHFNQNRAEDSARGGPRRGRLRSDLFAVESLARDGAPGGSHIPHLLQMFYCHLILIPHSSDA
jgi:hypothetical protein